MFDGGFLDISVLFFDEPVQMIEHEREHKQLQFHQCIQSQLGLKRDALQEDADRGECPCLFDELDDLPRFEEFLKSILGEAPIIPRTVVEWVDKARGQDESPALFQDSLEFTDRCPRIAQVLEHFRAKDRAELSVLKGKGVCVRDDIWFPFGIDIDRVAVREEAMVRRAARTDI